MLDLLTGGMLCILIGSTFYEYAAIVILSNYVFGVGGVAYIMWICYSSKNHSLIAII